MIAYWLTDIFLCSVCGWRGPGEPRVPGVPGPEQEPDQGDPPRHLPWHAEPQGAGLQRQCCEKGTAWPVLRERIKRICSNDWVMYLTVKGQCHEIFLPPSIYSKDSIWATYEQAKTVSRTFLFSQKCCVSAQLTKLRTLCLCSRWLRGHENFAKIFAKTKKFAKLGSKTSWHCPFKYKKLYTFWARKQSVSW